MNLRLQKIIPPVLLISICFNYLLFETTTNKLRFPIWTWIVGGFYSGKWGSVLISLVMLGLVVLCLISGFKKSLLWGKLRMISLSLMALHILYIMATGRFTPDYKHAGFFALATLLYWVISRSKNQH
ncbi:MAG: hypothetical protein EP332_07995 [Bacteroidetes bacterium]|nr:MAG: hypothetical protein EP332_07995 [Bacteroidota bacterium]